MPKTKAIGERCEKFNVSVSAGTTGRIEPYIKKGVFRSRSHAVDIALNDTALFIALTKRRGAGKRT